MKQRVRSLSLALGIGLALLAHLAREGAAHAQPTPATVAAAEALFDDGRKLKAEGNFAQACPKLEASQKMAPGMGTLYNLADCYEQLGRTASAWAGFREVAAQAAGAGQSDREKDARSRVAALEPLLMRLKVVVPRDGSVAAIEVKQDGAVMSPAVWGTAIPLDPGTHKVSASAAGKETWERAVEATERGVTVTVEVPPLQEKRGEPQATPPGPPAPPGPPGPPGPAVKVPNDGPPALPGPSAKRSWQLPLGIALTGAGAVGLGLGTAFGFMAKSTFDDSTPLCNDKNQCSDEGIAIRKEALSKGNIGTGIFVAGAVLAAGGVVLWITAPSAPKGASAPPQRSLGVAVGPGSLGLRSVF